MRKEKDSVVKAVVTSGQDEAGGEDGGEAGAGPKKRTKKKI